MNIPKSLHAKLGRNLMHYCVIKRGGKIVATGNNKAGSFRHNGELYMRHAECDALKKLLRQGKNKRGRGGRLTIIVIRPKLAESKPCSHCIKYMQSLDLNIRYVTYSSEGCLVTETLKDIENDHRTVHWRKNDYLANRIQDHGHTHTLST